MNLRQLFFDFQYRFSKPPWDSGITPPEVVAFVQDTTTRGRALDLGCGTGTNAIYLAQHGYRTVGVDFSAKAIATAREKARRTGLAIEFHVADVTRLDFLREPFDFILDIGCFHAVDVPARTRYVAGIARLTRPGNTYLLYAFAPRPPERPARLTPLRNVGITPEDVARTFAPHFTLDKIEHGEDRTRASAWYWFIRQATSL